MLRIPMISEVSESPKALTKSKKAPLPNLNRNLKTFVKSGTSKLYAA